MEIEKNPNKNNYTFSKIKMFILKLEKMFRNYFSAKGEDIYTRFVRRMFLVFFIAIILAGLIVFFSLIILAIGKPLVKVPDLKNLDVVEAIQELSARELLVDIDTKYDENYKKYIVVDQYPEKGITVRKGRFVKIIVSLGKDTYKVPNLVGLNRDAAEEKLNQLGIRYNIKEIQTYDYNTNVVISQDILPDQEVDRNTVLNIVVNSDVRPNEFKIKDYTRQPVDIVIKTLFANSIRPKIINVAVTNENEDGIVLSQNISPNTIVYKNSDIILQVGIYSSDSSKIKYYKWDYINYYFSYSVSDVGDTVSAQPINLRILLTDEEKDFQEIFNKDLDSSTYIIITFKYYKSAKVSIFINNNFVKEITYE